MFARLHRVHPQKVFDNNPTIIREPWVVARVVKNNLPYGRAAIIVSKKIAKHAVSRHLLKRRVSNSCKPLLLPGFDVLLTLTPQIKGVKGKTITLWCKKLNTRILETLS